MFQRILHNILYNSFIINDRQFYFQSVLDFGYWEDKIKADGWNFKREVHDTQHRIKNCLTEMNYFYENSESEYFEIMDVKIIMGIANWEDKNYFRSLLFLKKAMNKIVTSPMVFTNYFFQYLFNIALTITKYHSHKQ